MNVKIKGLRKIRAAIDWEIRKHKLEEIFIRHREDVYKKSPKTESDMGWLKIEVRKLRQVEKAINEIIERNINAEFEKYIKRESDMDVKELVELLRKHNKREGMIFKHIALYDDGSGHIALLDGERVFGFMEISELEEHFKKEQTPPDYKSLFSVVAGCLVADFSEIEITEENALPITWTKWVVRGEEMNKRGEILPASPNEAKTCACCIFYGFACKRCPIRIHTGVTVCGGTPIIEFGQARNANDLFAAMKANEKEEKFLKSLMDKQK